MPAPDLVQAEAREAFQHKFDELLSKPFSAFALFGFAQRVTLKRQKPNASVRELVKANGKCWNFARTAPMWPLRTMWQVFRSGPLNAQIHGSPPPSTAVR